MLFGREDYRKIWEDHYGVKIPDRYEIHHIDGNHYNNSIENLLLVTIEQHKEIHRSQGDWGAVQAISMRMNDRESISAAASKFQKQLLKENRHNFQMKSERRSEISKKVHYNRTEAFLGIKDKSANGSNARKKVKPENAKKQLDDIHALVKDTTWWTNKITGKRKRSKKCPGPDFIKGMKIK